MPKTIAWDKKTCMGQLHWSECKDWKLYTAGNVACADIFSIPVWELERLGWYRVYHDQSLEIPVVKAGWKYLDNGKSAPTRDEYWLVEIDWEYFLERRLLDVVSLQLTDEDVTKLHEIETAWLLERKELYRVQQMKTQAEQLAESFGMSAEDLLAFFLKKEQDIKNKKKEGVFIGTLTRIGNENFLVTEEGDKYKISKELFERDLAPTDEGKSFEFKPDLANPPKSSRKPKGWATELKEYK